MKWASATIDHIKAHIPNALVGGPFGSNLTTRDYVEEGVPVIRGTNLGNCCTFSEHDFVFVSEEKAEELSANIAGKGDLVFTQRGTLGQVGIIPSSARYDRYVVSQSQMKLTVDPAKADARFIYFFFRHPHTVQSIRNRAISSGVPHINLGILREFAVPLPPLPIQRRISAILSSYDDLLENNARRIKLLEDAARLLYEEWFVRLRFPGHEHTPIHNGLPEGWRRCKLVDLSEIVMGQSPSSQFYNDTGQGLPFHQGVTDFGDRFVTHRIHTTALNRIAEAGDILCSVRAPVGRLNMTLDKLVIGRGLAAMRSRTGHQSFLYHQLKTHFFKEDLIGAGAIFASVTKTELESQEFLTPPNALIRDFEDFSRPIDDQLRVLFLANKRLREARDLLLPRLMSGEVAV